MDKTLAKVKKLLEEADPGITVEEAPPPDEIPEGKEESAEEEPRPGD